LATWSIRLHADTEKLAFYPFTHPVPDGKDERIAVVMTDDGSRLKKRLAIFRHETKQMDVVSEAGLNRNKVEPLGWQGDRLFFLSDEGSEKESLYVYDDATRKTTRLWENPLKQANGYAALGSGRIVVETRYKDQGTLFVIDANDGKAVAQADTSAYELWWWNQPQHLADGTALLAAKASAARGYYVVRIDPSKPNSKELLRVAFEPEVNAKLLPSVEAEDVHYPTFDKDEAGKQRQIHAILFKPKNPPADPAKRAAIVYAHGGPAEQSTKAWNADIQFLCSLGR
jgi:dipeptidyl aminopeptidase/acylaminoacyl peptidase